MPYTRCDFIGASLILGYLPNLGAGRGKLSPPPNLLGPLPVFDYHYLGMNVIACSA